MGFHPEELSLSTILADQPEKNWQVKIQREEGQEVLSRKKEHVVPEAQSLLHNKILSSTNPNSNI